MPDFSALALEAITMPLAPSVRGQELPAVTVPPFLKTGGKAAIFS